MVSLSIQAQTHGTSFQAILGKKLGGTNEVTFQHWHVSGKNEIKSFAIVYEKSHFKGMLYLVFSKIFSLL